MEAWSMLFFVLSLEQIGLSSAEDPTYLVYFPKYLRPGFPIQIVAEILKNPNPVKLIATLSSPAKELNFILESEISEGESMLLTFTDTIPVEYDGTTDFNMTVFGVDTVTNKTVFDRSTDELVFKRKAVSIYIQTDKGIYKRSQTIKFRAVVTTPDLLPYSGKVSYKVIDPDDSIVFQRKNVQLAHGVAGSEFAIGRYATLGEWKVVFVANEYEKSVTISVDEYKLPKFEVEIKVDQTFLHEASPKISGSISAKFTFGQPVKASKVRLEFETVSTWSYYRSLSWWPSTTPRKISFTKNLENFDGEQDFSVTLADLKEKKLDLNFNSGDKVEVKAFVTDKNSLVELSDIVTIDLVSEYKRFKIEEIFVPKTMKPGLQYTAYLKISQYDGQTISDTDKVSIGLTITSQRIYPTKPIITEKRNLTFEDDGIIIINMTVKNDDFISTSFAINSKLYYLINWSADKFDSPSGMYIQMTTEQKNLKPGGNTTIEVGTTTDNKEYSIMMLARGKIIHQETYVPKSYEKVGSIYKFSYEFFVAKQMSPSVSIVILFMGDEGDIVSDTITLQVEYVFENTVNVKTSVQRTETGKPVNITVETSPDSLVALRAIDRSVILQKEGNDITSENVIDDLDEYGTDQPTTRRRWFWYPISTEGSNSRELFKKSGIIVFTDAEAFMNQTFSPILIYEDDFEYDDNGIMFAMAEDAMPVKIALQMDDDSSSGSVSKRLQPVVQTRKNFVETWIWEEMDIGNNGLRTFSYVLPDTATTWEISVFAISNTTGLGVAETDPQIIATRDFFISLDLPISMVSGEELMMRATVYNFFDTDLNVTLTLENSDWYNVSLTSNNTGRSGNVRKIIVPKKEGKTESFSVKFLKPGNAVVKMEALSELAGDRIERTVPIKPEGIQNEISESVLIERSIETAGNTVQEFLIKIPDDVVDGSTYGKISVSGNIMGNSLNNLGSLLKMPSGCGEQNMINFAPDVYISLYLEKVGLLSGSVEEKSRKHIQQGYRRELTYQRNDGSFSAFGQNDKNGSTWLTAFVIKCFISAMELRDDLVDETTVDEGVDFLLSQQEKDGSFREDGKVLHMDLQGGAGIRKNLTMTAYVVVAMTEGGYNLKRKDLLKTVDKAMQFLEKNAKVGDDTFALAIATYALALSGSKSATLLMDELERRAKYLGELKYWAAEDVDEPQCEHMWDYHCRTPTSSDIEITSYCLLTLIRLGRTDNLMPIVQWIIKQRGSYGGFRSTQDTVMAIQALSVFAGQYSDRVLDVELLVTHSADSGFSANLSVNKDNAIVLQSKELPAASGNVSVTASGVGFADVQVSYLYNVPIAGRSEEPFAIDIEVDVSNGFDNVKVGVCTSINMKKAKPLEETGMFIVSMDLPSGYSASDTTALEKNKIAKLVELEGSEITFYFDQLAKGKELCFEVDLERFANVARVKPKGLRASEYYKPDRRSVRSYEIPGLGESSVCEVCGKECFGCAGGASKISRSMLLVALLSILTTFILTK